MNEEMIERRAKEAIKYDLYALNIRYWLYSIFVALNRGVILCSLCLVLKYAVLPLILGFVDASTDGSVSAYLGLSGEHNAFDNVDTVNVFLSMMNPIVAGIGLMLFNLALMFGEDLKIQNTIFRLAYIYKEQAQKRKGI